MEDIRKGVGIGVDYTLWNMVLVISISFLVSVVVVVVVNAKYFKHNKH